MHSFGQALPLRLSGALLLALGLLLRLAR